MQKKIRHWHWYGVILFIVALIIMGEKYLIHSNYNIFFSITTFLIMLLIFTLWKFPEK